MIAESSQPIPEYALLISEKGAEERRVPMRGTELTIGRVAGNEVVLPKGNVSKRHARILYREGRFIITDLNSTNGTYVNRKKIEQATIIREDDRIYIGDFVIRFELVSGEFASEPKTPHREPELTAPIPTLAPPEDRASRPPHHSSAPPWDRPSSLPEEPNVSRPSAAPQPRSSEVPAPEPSHPSQRVSDVAVAQRRAIRKMSGLLLEKKGVPGIEPSAAYADAVKELGAQIVDQLLVDGQIPVGTSAESILDYTLLEILGFGPLAELLADPLVTSISVPRFDEVQEVREGRGQFVPPGFSSPEALDSAVVRLAKASSQTLAEHGLSRVTLRDGSLMTVIRGAAAPTGPVLLIEKPRRQAATLDDLVRRGAVSRAMATFLGQAVQARLNLLLVGAREAGTDVIAAALAQASRERTVVFSAFHDYLKDSENIVRVRPPAPQEGEASLAALVSSLCALPSAHLLVPMESPELVRATLDVASRGATGLLGIYEAAHLRRALCRLPLDAAADGAHGALPAQVRAAASAFDLAIEVSRLRDGRVRVLRISELKEEAGSLVATDLFRFSVARVAVGGAVEGNFAPTGVTPEVLPHMQMLGFRVEGSMFQRPSSR